MLLSPEDVVQTFRDVGALLEGHFVYASGRHGREFLQAARVLQYPRKTELLCRSMAEQFEKEQIDLVVGPATGGIILAYETARHLKCRAAFTEKEGKDRMLLKRGFHLEPGTRVLVVEDVVTTGGSIKKTIDHLVSRDAAVIGVSALIDRSSGKAKFDSPFLPLAALHLESWPAKSCGLCQAKVPILEPDDMVLQP
jgi:orotate phosphoribosyltransferase